MADTTTKPLPSPLTVGLSRTRLEVKQFFREREQLIFTFFFPIIFLGIFSAVFGGTDFTGGVNAATYFTPGMIASGIFLTSFQSLAITHRAGARRGPAEAAARYADVAAVLLHRQDRPGPGHLDPADRVAADDRRGCCSASTCRPTRRSG